MTTIDLTWGEADEEICVTYSVDPADPSVGIPNAGAMIERVHNRDTSVEWGFEHLEAEAEALQEYIEARGGCDPPEPDWDSIAEERRERRAGW
ncbi:MAG: hypothetical protein A2X69_00645 [Rhodobacteraceae bacterium GWF1_65_7]|nr:MAG: hypothetical protein A2X69_00645 [Rhodobacteraceae bacterium GWF1_65_7]